MSNYIWQKNEKKMKENMQRGLNSEIDSNSVWRTIPLENRHPFPIAIPGSKLEFTPNRRGNNTSNKQNKPNLNLVSSYVVSCHEMMLMIMTSWCCFYCCCSRMSTMHPYWGVPPLMWCSFLTLLCHLRFSMLVKHLDRKDGKSIYLFTSILGKK